VQAGFIKQIEKRSGRRKNNVYAAAALLKVPLSIDTSAGIATARPPERSMPERTRRQHIRFANS
jgi:hypothetical protein